MEVDRIWPTLKPKLISLRFILVDYNIPCCFLFLSIYLLSSHFPRIYYLADIIFLDIILLQDRSSSSSSSFLNLLLPRLEARDTASCDIGP